MSRRVLLVVGLVLCGLLGLLMVPVLMFMVVIGDIEQPEEGCVGGGGAEVAVAANASSSGGLTSEQLANAAAIVAQGNEMGIPRRGIVIALAVASQESGFRNYANDGEGDDLTFVQRGVDASLSLPHEAVGTDHGSVGVFQQQWPWWGPLEVLMDPAASAELFYRSLLRVPNWEGLPLTVAAQTVQVSAYPDAYADDEAVAERILSDPGLGDAAAIVPASASAACSPAGLAPGTVTFPLPRGSSYVDQSNWGASGARWSSGHTGTDFSAACGTPVLAATNGTVIVRTDQPWSGRWLVQVSTGEGRLTTWYAHMQALNVEDGESVDAGQQIGEVGTLGNSTGCHLHFEVHPQGGSIYEDNVDPSAWLARNVGRDLPGPQPEIQPISGNAGSPDETRVATFNVLGHSHTRPGGNKPSFAPSSARTRWAVQLLEKYGVDIVALQEFESVQAGQFRRGVGSRWGLYRGSHAEAIGWRKSEWGFVRGGTIPIPYFNGKTRRMPVVTLRNSEGQDLVVTSFHNPASVKRVGDQSRWRAIGFQRQVALAHRVENAGLPVLIMGDMNERHSAFCDHTSTGALVAAAGGSHAGGCHPPGFDGIDWIFGSPSLEFSDHTAVRGGLVGRATDHPFIVARVE